MRRHLNHAHWIGVLFTPEQIKVGRLNEHSALQVMCDAEKDWNERSFRACGALQGRRNFPLCKPEILFSFCNFSCPGSHIRKTVNSARVLKEVIFTVNRKKCRLILTVKKFQGISNLTISADYPELLAPKEFQNWKNNAAPMFSKTLPPDITTCLYVIVRAKETSKTQQLI